MVTEIKVELCECEALDSEEFNIIILDAKKCVTLGNVFFSHDVYTEN